MNNSSRDRLMFNPQLISERSGFAVLQLWTSYSIRHLNQLPLNTELIETNGKYYE